MALYTCLLPYPVGLYALLLLCPMGLYASSSPYTERVYTFVLPFCMVLSFLLPCSKGVYVFLRPYPMALSAFLLPYPMALYTSVTTVSYGVVRILVATIILLNVSIVVRRARICVLPRARHAHLKSSLH